jgi:hypothetical protein
MRFRDVVGDAAPLGLHYFPSGLVPPGDAPVTPYFLNYLHCYDQISVMQRKLMDVSDGVAALKDARLAARFKRHLFFAQDINRFLPQAESGFAVMPDRLWTYGRLIDIEGDLYGRLGVSGGVIRLSEFLRNGNKSIVVANRSLKLYIDHKNGGQVYELDYIDRSFNACAAYNPAIRKSPEAVDPRESKLAFRDRVLVGRQDYGDYKTGYAADRGNFSCLPMEYTFKSSQGGGARIILNAAGAFTEDGRQNPLTIDKVFGLEKDAAVLTYSYKLGNPATTPYAFTFAIEFPLALPGTATGQARLKADDLTFDLGAEAKISVNDITSWLIDDEEIGVRMEFVTQKKVNLRVFAEEAASGAAGSTAKSKRAYGTMFVMTIPMEIDTNSTQSFTGRIGFRKIRRKGGIDNDSL